MIVYGSNASRIGNFDIPHSKCDHCQQEGTQKVSVFGKYAHIFWIPVFPIGKKAVAECAHCKRTIEQKDFSQQLKQYYFEKSVGVKRPLWHWIGSGVLGLALVVITLNSVFREKDPRSILLQNDLKLMTSSPTIEGDSISFKLKQVFDEMANEDLNPHEFQYLTKTDGDKALILVKMPKLKRVQKEGRGEAIELIEMVLDEQEGLNGKERYIGVHGAISMMMIKTPTYNANSKIALTSELYDFYGPKPVRKD